MKVINTENNSENEGELIFKGFWCDIARGFGDILGWILVIVGIAYLFSGEYIPFKDLTIFVILLLVVIFLLADILKIEIFLEVKRCNV